jgi:adenylate cyclase
MIQRHLVTEHDGMGLEIERKFLVLGEAWKALGEGTVYRQGYLSIDPERTVRVRCAGPRAFLTVKGAAEGTARAEYEYEIDVGEAEAMLDGLCLRPLVEKIRYRVPFGGLVWEVDEFMGDNRGLVLAEVELVHVDQTVVLPDWVGEEVSGDPRYFNSHLVRQPFNSW